MKTRLLFIVVLLSATLAVFARLKFNGLVYGFDYGLYQPDGVDYSYKTLQMLGKDSVEASMEVSSWYSVNSFKMQGLTPEEVLSGQSTFPQSRVFFSLLSMPFVKLLGIQGMLVVPIISFFTLQISILVLGVKKNRIEVASILALVMSTSPTVLRWMINDCSDALFVGLLCLIPLMNSSKNVNFQRIVLSGIVIAASLTRFSLPIFICLSLVFFFYKRYFDALILLFISFLSNIPSLLETRVMLMPQTEGDFLYKISRLPLSAIKVGFIEVAQLSVLDRLLLFFLIGSIILAILNFRSESSIHFFAVFISVWGLGALNGTLGVNFRYQLPVLIFCCWVVIDHFPRFSLQSGYSTFKK